jgi:hypothetical protein
MVVFPLAFQFPLSQGLVPAHAPFRAFRAGTREAAASRGVRPPRSAWPRCSPTTCRGHHPFSAVPGVRRTTSEKPVHSFLAPRIASTPGSVRMGRIQGVPGTPRGLMIHGCLRDGWVVALPDRARTSCLESCLGRGCNGMLRGSFEADGLPPRIRKQAISFAGSKRTRKKRKQPADDEQPHMLHVSFPTHMTLVTQLVGIPLVTALNRTNKL